VSTISIPTMLINQILMQFTPAKNQSQIYFY